MPQPQFHRELTQLLNRYSVDAEHNCPDFILAGFLVSCLDAFSHANGENDRWHGVSLAPGGVRRAAAAAERRCTDAHELLHRVLTAGHLEGAGLPIVKEARDILKPPAPLAESNVVLSPQQRAELEWNVGKVPLKTMSNAQLEAVAAIILPKT